MRTGSRSSPASDNNELLSGLKQACGQPDPHPESSETCGGRVRGSQETETPCRPGIKCRGGGWKQGGPCCTQEAHSLQVRGTEVLGSQLPLHLPGRWLWPRHRLQSGRQQLSGDTGAGPQVHRGSQKWLWQVHENRWAGGARSGVLCHKGTRSRVCWPGKSEQTCLPEVRLCLSCPRSSEGPTDGGGGWRVAHLGLTPSALGDGRLACHQHPVL